MSDQPTWGHISQLTENRNKFQYLFFALSGVSIILLLQVLFVSPQQRDNLIFTSHTLILLTLGCLLITGFIAYKYVQLDIYIKRLSRDSYSSAYQREVAQKSKELLRKAGVGVVKKKSLPVSGFYQQVVPTKHVAPIQKIQKPIVNILPFKLTDEVAENFMRKKGIDKKMKTWIQNIRIWMSKDLITLILTNHRENLDQLNQFLKYYTENRAERPWIFEKTLDEASYLNLSYEELNYYKKVGLKEIQELARQIGQNYANDLQVARNFNIRNPPPAGCQEALARVKFIEVYKQRMILEKFFEIPEYNARAYTLNRFYQLVQPGYLQGYSSSGGGSYLGSEWTAKRPTDAHILAHLFFRTLNNGNNPNVETDFDMMNRIVVKYSNIRSENKVFFYQKNSDIQIEPHYDILSGEEIWPAYKGNDNLFSAIALFLLHLKEKSKGYFYSMNCNEFFHLIRQIK